MMRRMGLAGLLMAIVLCDAQLSGARDVDIFARGRRQELARDAAHGTVVLRPWGGPTTDPSWWTPMRGPARTYYYRVPQPRVYNYYYFAPFSYPYIVNGFGWGY